MTEEELKELEAGRILTELSTTEDNSEITTYDDSDDVIMTKQDRLNYLYTQLRVVEEDITQLVSTMNTKEILQYRKDITSEIASLEGRMNTNDMTKYIPMNVTFNIQNNHA